MRCRHCDREIEAPHPETIKLGEFFDDQFDVDITQSVQHHIQLSCPECEKILGYLGVAGAHGGPNTRGAI